MRIQQNPTSDNERARPEQDCQVNLTFCSKATENRRGARGVCCKFKDFLRKRDGKRKNAAFGEAEG